MTASVNGLVRVLLVDDEEILRAVVRSLVEATPGFALVGEAVDGVAALERVAALRPDLVLMDNRMFPLDGIAACREVTERHPGTAVLVMSVDGVAAADLEGSGAIGFVRKQDLSPSRLRRIWSDHVAKPSGARALGPSQRPG